MIQKPIKGQAVKIGHCSRNEEADATITEVLSDTKVKVHNNLGEAEANWFRADQIDCTILPYGEVWCYAAEDEPLTRKRINVAGPTCSVLFNGDGTVTTDGWREEIDESQFLGFTEGELEHFNDQLSNARVDGMESTLLALTKAGIIDRNDARLKDALTEVYDALSNHS